MKKAFHLMLVVTILAAGATAIARADHGDHGDNNSGTRLKTKLAGGAIQGKTPEGSAEFRTDAKNRSEFKVEVENVNLPAGTVLDVTVGASSTLAGHITLNKFGEGELELRSQDGDTVPSVAAHDTVTVSNAGSAILSGTF